MGNGTELARRGDDNRPGAIEREGFGSSEMERSAETSSVAAAETAKALVNARYVMALRNPRDMDDVRVKLLKECKRPGFAAVARYSKPVGGQKIEGFSIRFAEAVARCLKNVDIQTPAVFDDDEKRIVRVMVTDLEANLTYSADVTVEKTVERRKIFDSHEVIRARQNKQGVMVYVVRATDDELLSKQNNLISKAIRNGLLRVLPGDIQDECKAIVEQTVASETKADPDAARKKIVDGFAELNVRPSDLKTYLGHDVDQCSPAELDDLRKVYAAIKTGETNWRETLAQREKPAETAADNKQAPSSTRSGRAKAAVEAKAKAATETKREEGEVPAEEEPSDEQLGIAGT